MTLERFFKRKAPFSDSESRLPSPSLRVTDDSTQSRIEVNMNDLEADPALRRRIMDFDPNIRDQVRRAYALKGPCQPRGHDYPQRMIGTSFRRFKPAWFDSFGSWLEYSVSNDAAYCLCCYLFKPDMGERSGGDTFVTKGFSNWKKNTTFKDHVGVVNSVHLQAMSKYQDLLNQKQHIQPILIKQTDEAKRDYRTRLNASINVIRLLLKQGLAFRGHDESEGSSQKGNFLELLGFLADQNEEVKAVVLKKAPENLKLTSPKIQKDIVRASAILTTNAIVNDIGDALFSILIDESRDISIKEQMAVVVRYVDKKGCVIERFLGIRHVASTTALTLKVALEALFSTHGLSMSKLRVQGYDGASNMQGELNGLKTLIMKENPSAYYIHCFAHQLQLALVGVARHHLKVGDFFNVISLVVNVVGASCKRRDILLEKQAISVEEALSNGELKSGKGLNQETTLKRAGDTRWGSHYGSLISMIGMFSSVVDVLFYIKDEGHDLEKRIQAGALSESIQSFDFVFNLHLMKVLLGITNDLSQALQKKDQDILNGMTLVKVSKQRLQIMRDSGWDSLFDEISLFCEKHGIVVPRMDEMHVAPGRSRRRVEEMTNLHKYKVEYFYNVIDLQLQELNDRFNEVNTELLICLASLSPSDSFHAFEKEKLIRFAQFYPKDFDTMELIALGDQLENYIVDMRSNSGFSNLKGIGDLATQLVAYKKDKDYVLVYRLLTLALILPVATASVERVFSAMKIVKNCLRNRMGDEWTNDNLVVYIENEIFHCIGNKAIIEYFQNMRTRRGHL